MNDANRPQNKKTGALAIAVRICFCVVFLINIQYAFSFVIFPETYVSSFQLSGVEGVAAVRGLGVVFLMWNATYPAFIASPGRFVPLGWVIIAQQIIGLLGESFILSSVVSLSGYEVMASSILRFIVFDGTGLVVMAVSFLLYLASRKRDEKRLEDTNPDTQDVCPSKVDEYTSGSAS